MKFMVTVWAAFLARVKPVSTIAKPACMNMTRKPATSVQTMLMALVLSATTLATSSSFGGAASAMSIATVAKVMALLEQGNWKQPVATAGPARKPARRHSGALDLHPTKMCEPAKQATFASVSSARAKEARFAAIRGRHAWRALALRK